VRLTYLSEAIIPGRASNATQTMRMCAGFAEAGADVTLVYPRAHEPAPKGFDGDIEAFYGVRKAFERRCLRVPTAPGASGAQRVARALPFMAHLVHRARPGQPVFNCYARSLQSAWIAVQARRMWGPRAACRAVVVELHDEPPARAWSLLAGV
jgi:hypothetical protein